MQLDAATPPGDAGMEPEPEPDPDAAVPIDWIAGDGVGPCEVPGDLPADPLERTALADLRRAPGARGPIHVLDIEIDFDTGLIYTVGTGGFFTLRHTERGFETLGVATTRVLGRGGQGDFDKLEVLGEGLVAISHRETGWWIYDANYRLSEQLGHPVVLVYFATW